MGIFEKLMETDLTSGDTEQESTKLDKVINSIKEQGYNLNEMETILRNTKRFQLVESVAGSGKTTTLNFKLLADNVSGRSWGKKIWVNTFLKTGATALRDDLFDKVRSLGIAIPVNDISFSTIHSEYYKILSSIGLKISIISPEIDREMKNGVSKDFGIGNYPGYLTNNEISVFNLLESYINNTIEEVNPARLVELGLDELSANPDSVVEAVRILRERRLKAEMYSYDDLQTIMYKYLVVDKVPALLNIIRNRYKFIYLDEFQDTSRIQYEIMKIYFENAEQVVFVGDSDQSIYSWRGADVEIITKSILEDFDTDIQNLTINYRVPENILSPIAKSIVKNTSRLPKDVVSSRPNEGITELRSFNKKSDMDKDVVKTLIKYQDENSIDSIAVLSSINIDITELALNILTLTKNNPIDFSIGGTPQDLNRKVYKDVWAIAYLFTNTPNENLKGNLKYLSDNTISNYNASKAEEYIRNSGQNFFSLSPNGLVTAVQGNTNLKQIYSYISETSGNSSKLEDLKNLYTSILLHYATRIQEEPKFKGLYEDKASKVVLMLQIIEEYGVNTPEEFIGAIQEINKEIKEHFNRKNTKILLTTPFDFKGKEADLIYLYSDTNGKFPRAKATNYEEERRLHYIAGTRAKKVMIYSTLKGKESPFLQETGLLD